MNSDYHYEHEPLTPLELADCENSVGYELAPTEVEPPVAIRHGRPLPPAAPQLADVADEPQTPAPRFADGFLQEGNIKWILGVGTIITLGSSLMLVSSHWGGFNDVFKELIILAYTALILGAGRYAYERLALRRTGTVLLALAVMLAPVACAALPLVWASGTWNAWYLALLAGAAALTARIGSRSFLHFFRARQPSLTIPYVILALAGAIVPLASAEFGGMLRSPLMALALWCVFAVGTVKVNRTVFHLLEEQRRPRIFGFFPMLLLALQYFGLFAACFAAALPLDWIGFGLVPTAIPLLLAADVVAEVFRQRTGDLVRPLPWSIMLPLLAGLIACVAGVGLAAVKILEPPPYALVPTALLAAAVLVQVARRTEKQPFVYAALALSTTAYRYLPVYFAAATKALIASTAAAIQEPKLPIAYFGFTFVPLLAAFTFAGLRCERRGNRLFSGPTKAFAVGLSFLFLALAPTHAKALFPASLTLLGVFAAQTALFRNRTYIVPALVAAMFAAAGVPVFLHGVLGYDGALLRGPTAWFTCEVVLAGLLLVPGVFIDRLLSRVPARFLGNDFAVAAAKTLAAPCRYGSILLTLLLATGWLYAYGFRPAAGFGLTTGLLLAALALTHAYANAESKLAPIVGTIALAFANIMAWITLCEFAWNGRPLTDLGALSIAVGGLLAQWIAGYSLAARPQWRLSQAFALATHLCSFVLLGVMVFCYAVLHLFAAFGLADDLTPAFWCASIALVVWLFDAARRRQAKVLGTIAIFAEFALATSASQTLLPGTVAWIPLWWVGVTALLALGATLLARSPRQEAAFAALIAPANVIVPTLLLLVSLCSLVAFSPAAISAGLAAPLVLMVWYSARRDPLGVQLPLALLTWRSLGVVVALVEPRFRYLFQTDIVDALRFCPLIAPAAALAVVAWTWGVHRQDRRRVAVGELDIGLFQIDALRYLTFGLLGLTLRLPSLAGERFTAVITTFGLLAIAELYVALRKNKEVHVWKAFATVSACVAMLIWFGAITFGRGWAMYIVLAVGIALRIFGHCARRHEATAVFARPFTAAGLLLPGLAVVIGVARHVVKFELGYGSVQWVGWNSLALFTAAMLYFREWLVVRERNVGHQVVRARDSRFFVAAAAIVNTALLLLWRECRFTDPQFYMIPIGFTILLLVELLEREIPAGYRDPLRYLGALAILVSPTFHIVTGSWLHLFSLMVASVLVILAAIGFRLRAVMYTGAAFLVADLAAMIGWGSVNHPELLWVAGAAFGAGILGLGAVCELKREQVQQRVRAVGAALAEWK